MYIEFIYYCFRSMSFLQSFYESDNFPYLFSFNLELFVEKVSKNEHTSPLLQ